MLQALSAANEKGIIWLSTQFRHDLVHTIYMQYCINITKLTALPLYNQICIKELTPRIGKACIALFPTE